MKYKSIAVCGVIALTFSFSPVVSAQSDENKAETKANDPSKVEQQQNVMALDWYQTSGEMESLYYQGYNLGQMKLDEKLKEGTDKKPAIVLDIDETILDNSEYYALHANSSNHLSRNEFYSKAESKALPGAIDFLDYADDRGVDIYYISDRKDKLENPTIENLEEVDAPQAKESHVLLGSEEELDQNMPKRERRQKVKQNHDIVLYFGDSLTDFPGFTKSPIKQRNQKTKDMQDEFGDKFISFPNPMYGNWEDAMYDYKDVNDQQKIISRQEHLMPFNN